MSIIRETKTMSGQVLCGPGVKRATRGNSGQIRKHGDVDIKGNYENDKRGVESQC